MKINESVIMAIMLCVFTWVPRADAHSPNAGTDTVRSAAPSVDGMHDFDFFVGRWEVHHHRLKQWLANSNEWIDFQGTTETQLLMGGLGNLDDNVLEAPSGAYRAVTLRSFDRTSRQWSIWWLDSRSPKGPLDPPVRGSFRDGVGMFYAEDILNGKPIRVRLTWSHITPTSCQWEQAYSPDAGATWETNWVMTFTRAL